MSRLRDIKLLCPVVRDKVILLEQECERGGTPILIVETLRRPLVHLAYYAQGRDFLDGVNAKRERAGLPEITAEENAHEITWVIESIHQYDCAADFALLIDGKPSWDTKADINHDNIMDYENIGIIAEGLGFEWGGRFKKKDYVHIQYTGGLTLAELRAGIRPDYDMF